MHVHNGACWMCVPCVWHCTVLNARAAASAARCDFGVVPPETMHCFAAAAAAAAAGLEKPLAVALEYAFAAAAAADDDAPPKICP